MMDQFIQWITESEVMVVILGICFTTCMMLYRNRVKREESPAYKPPKPPNHQSEC